MYCFFKIQFGLEDWKLPKIWVYVIKYVRSFNQLCSLLNKVHATSIFPVIAIIDPTVKPPQIDSSSKFTSEVMVSTT